MLTQVEFPADSEVFLRFECDAEQSAAYSMTMMQKTKGALGISNDVQVRHLEVFEQNSILSTVARAGSNESAGTAQLTVQHQEQRWADIFCRLFHFAHLY